MPPQDRPAGAPSVRSEIAAIAIIDVDTSSSTVNLFCARDNPGNNPRANNTPQNCRRRMPQCSALAKRGCAGQRQRWQHVKSVSSVAARDQTTRSPTSASVLLRSRRQSRRTAPSATGRASPGMAVSTVRKAQRTGRSTGSYPALHAFSWLM